jgi:dTDP-4-dehydrorhamnose 3,5-epimerase
MNRFNVFDLPLEGLKLIERERLVDSRGYFSRLFCAQELSAAGWHLPIAQMNHTFTAKRGTVRGIHYQKPPKAEMKLVTCIKGEVWDVAVDLRNGSPTFLKWHAEILSEQNNRSLLIPEGFAHGFQVIEPESELLYLHTEYHDGNNEAGLRYDDPMLGVMWPIEVSNFSVRDANHALIDRSFQGVNS